MFLPCDLQWAGCERRPQKQGAWSCSGHLLNSSATVYLLHKASSFCFLPAFYFLYLVFYFLYLVFSNKLAVLVACEPMVPPTLGKQCTNTLSEQSLSVLTEPVAKLLIWVLQDGGQKVNSIFERARALGATEGSIADLQQPSSSGTHLAGHARSCHALQGL